MKPAYPYPPRPEPVREGRADSVLLGVGATLLVVATATLAVLLFFILPKAHLVISETFGTGMDRFRAIGFLADARGVLFVGLVFFEVVFAAVLAHTRRPGRWLVIEGVVVACLAMILVVAVWAEVRYAVGSLAGSLDAARMKPLRPL